jgi:glutamate carboxypeptidase
MTERAKELQEYFTEHQRSFVNLLQSLVEEETPSDVPSSFSTVFPLLKQEFEKLNLKVEHITSDTTAGQLIAKPVGFNPDAPIKLIVGHCDTVWELDTLEEMPFKVEGNTVSGPGVYDMKAGITMMIFAMCAVRDLDKDVAVQPVFLISSDEETGSEDSKSLIIEKAKKAQRTFVLEPSLGTEGKIKTRRKGIGEFEIRIKGKPSHAGLNPEDGVSAILGLSSIVQQLFTFNDPDKGITINVGTIEGGSRANVVAAESKAKVEVRVPNQAEGERIKDKIYGLESELEGIEIEVSGDFRRPPLEKNEANQALWESVNELGEELDLDLQEGTSGGASDGNFTNLYSPTLDGLGAVGEGAHAYHEKIYLDKTLQRTALFTLLLLQPTLEEL